MDKVIISIEFSESEAESFCKFCDRAYFDIFKNVSTNEAEAYEMRDALHKVWKALTAVNL